MPFIRLCLTLGLLALAAGCTSLSEEQCRAGDWSQIGVADGAEGRGTDRIEAHRRACAEAGITPDTEAWMRGRERGLRLYCTPAKAYTVARRGRSIAPGCTGAEVARMQPAIDRGRSYWRLEVQIDDVRSDIRGLEREAGRLRPDAPGRRSLLARRSMLISRLGVLELQQRRYARWP